MKLGSISTSFRTATLVAAPTFMLLIGPLFAANKNTVSVSATVLNKSGCFFVGATTALAFGNIDPSLNTNATATANVTVQCKGNTGTTNFLINRDSGQNAAGTTLRMQNTSTPGNFLPYTINLNGPTGPAWAAGAIGPTVPIANNTNVTFVFGANVTPVSYQPAVAGPYSDSVILTITP